MRVITYRIDYCAGTPRYVTGTTADVIAAIREECGDEVEYGHDGDLCDGGDRTLFWASEDASSGDNGAHALGSETKRRSVRCSVMRARR